MYINSVEYLKTYLRRAGYEIVDCDKQYCDVCPHLIVWNREADAIVYIDLRIYESPPVHAPRLWYRNWKHRALVCKEFTRWMLDNKWHGKHRFDVVTVLPTYGCVGRPIIDHIVDVKM